MSDNRKLWGGRFNLSTDKLVDDFNASISFDKRLYSYDIRGSIAHAKMLAKQGIITTMESDQIVIGLDQILSEIETGKFIFSEADEDIHMAVEKRLIEIIGDTGGKLHTARSRNDQVALDIRLYIRDQVESIKSLIIGFLEVLVKRAEKDIDVISPGFTHLQAGQPILFSHYFLAYFQMLKRDYTRFTDLAIRLNYSPLGAGALAGTSFDIDRHFVAKELDFYGVTENSIDSVSDRDFALELLSTISITMMHLSRFSEEIILFSTSEFNYITLSDDFCTGSSIMPQKKNPDVAELIRGKTARVYGNMITLFTLMKALPLAYNKDMQEDKEPIFDSVDTVTMSLKIFASMIDKMELNAEKLKIAAAKGYSTATDIADYLVRKGLPFRQAHYIVGKVVAYAVEEGIELSQISLPIFQSYSNLIEVDIYDSITLEASVSSRESYGGTAKSQVLKQIELAKSFINENS